MAICFNCEIVRIGLAIVVANGVCELLIIISKINGYPRSVPFIATMLLLIFMLGLRVFYRLYIRKLIVATKTKNAVIIGAGVAGSIALRDLVMSSKSESRIIGFIDDNKAKKGQIISGVEVLGTTDQLKELVKKYDLSITYIAIKNITKNRMKEIIEKCKEAKLQVKIINFEVIDGEQNELQIREVSIDDLLGRGEIKLDNTGIRSYLEGKTVMVTGAGGSIGSELCRQIVKFCPKELILVDIYENNMYDLQQEILSGQQHGTISKNIHLICLIASIRESKRVDEIIKKYQPHVLFHAAAHKHVPLVEDSPFEAIKNNVFGTLNVVNCCINNNVEKMIAISTDKAVNPTNVMGATKRLCELIIQANRNNGVTKLAAVRFGNVLGSNGSVIPLFKKQIASGGPVTVTDPNIERYFMTIPEASQLVLQAGAFATEGQIFVLDMGTPVKILTLAENLITLSGLTPYEDIKIEFTGLRPGEKMYEELNLEQEEHSKTHNELISVTKSLNISQSDLNEKLDILQDELNKNDVEHIKKAIFELIK